MKKTILLAAAAVSAMAFAGTASAQHTLTFRATAAAGDIDSGDVGGATGSYKLAAEAANVAPTFGTFALVDTLSASASLPSGNVILTVALSGGTYGAAVTGAAVTADAPACTTFTATPSSGGALGSTSVTYIISNSSAGCGAFNLDLPIAPNAGVPVTVTTTLATEAGTPIDGLTASRAVLTRPSAFNTNINGAVGGAVGGLTDTFATLTVLPVYTTFKLGVGAHAGAETATVAQLGTVEILADTTAYRDLAKTFVTTADVTAATVTVTGDYTAFDGAGGATTLGGIAQASAAGTVRTFSGPALTTALVDAGLASASVTPEPFIVTRETAAVAIPTSTYAVSVAYTLASPAYTPEGPFAGNFETIGRDGTNVIVPWLNSNSIQTTNGTTNIIRLGNVSGTAVGPVFAQVLNSTLTAGVATAPVQLFPSIAANGERVISTAALTTALGEFGRGDVQISIEAPASAITARRYATLANGSVTEVPNGTVASDQTPADVTDVP
jgi:hypothetical protein